MGISTKGRILFGMRDDGDMTEPMSIMLLSALAKKNANFETDLWVMERDDLSQTLKRFRPDIVAFSGITGSHKYYLEAAKRVKTIDSRPKIIVGGPHFTFFPGEILRNESIDALCVGEGDDAWVEWLKAFENNLNQNEIPNIVTRENMEKVLKNPKDQVSSLNIINHEGPSQSPGMVDYSLDPKFMRGRKTDLDDLPFLDRGLIYDNTEFKYRYKRTIMASRGCPFRCTYCFEHQWNALYKKVRNPGAIRQLYGVDRLLDELEDLIGRYDTRFIKFYDDVFPPFPNIKEKAWHEEFCEKYPKRIGLPFHVLTRCDLVVDLFEKGGMDILKDWKKIGMASLTMSIESGNQFIRDHVVMRDMTRYDIETAFRRCWNIGLDTFPNDILGIPAPIIPKVNDPDFDEKIQEVKRQCKILREINHRKIDLDAVEKTASDWFIDSYERRKYIVNFLKSAGLRESYKEYDKESVLFVLKQRPGFPEFPILAPYPKTKATEWCMAIGAFDGDFNRLHASYQNVSYLSYYDDEYKKVMHNYELLGSFASLFSGSRNPIMRFFEPLILKICFDYLAEITSPKATKFYGWLYTVSKTYLHYKKIYPIKYSLIEKFRFFKQMSGLDFWKQFKERKNRPLWQVRGKSLRRAERPGQTLGGPPSI